MVDNIYPQYKPLILIKPQKVMVDNLYPQYKPLILIKPQKVMVDNITNSKLLFEVLLR
jgi:hypothetical protein